MTAPEAPPIPLRVCPPGEVDLLVAARTGDVHRQMEALRQEMDGEMRARAVAESEADLRADHVAELRAEVGRLDAANARLRARLMSRAWTRAWPFALGGLAGGFSAVVLRWAVGG